MHRSYNPYTPASSKLLQKRWDDHHYQKHRSSVNNVRPEIDSSPPITFMHLHLKLKKLQLEEERLATIERDNRILLEKMSQIMRTKGRIDNSNDIEFKSLSRDRRERELLRISKENMNMFRRINGKKAAISVEKLEKDWHRNLRYMDNISAFPEDWYLRDKQLTSARSNPNISTSRSATEKKNPAQASEDDGEKKSDAVENTEKTDSKNTTKKASMTSKKGSKSAKEATKKEGEEKKYEDDFD